MLITPHIAAGAAIGITFQDPTIVFPAAVASHFVLDMVPHWDPDPSEMRKAVGLLTVDFCVAMIVLLWAISQHHGDRRAIFWGGFGAMLPDIIENDGYRLRQGPFSFISTFHKRIHFSRELSFFSGIMSQIIFLFFTFWVIKS
jgi:hypothetical protein